MTPAERLRDAISGERRDWHKVEVSPDDIAALLAAPAVTEAADLDVRPELVQWFHDGEEQCEHDYDPPSCALLADHLLRAFTVEPRLTERPDGTFSFEAEHFVRLHRAALAGTE